VPRPHPVSVLPRILILGTWLNKVRQRVTGCLIAVCLPSRVSLIYWFLLAPGRRGKLLCAPDADLGYASETKLPLPFDQIHLEPCFEVSQNLLYRVPVHFLFSRRLPRVLLLRTWVKERAVRPHRRLPRSHGSCYLPEHPREP
jgi:hypothetical protein